MCDGKPVFNGFSLSIALGSEAEARAVFAKLSDGGTIRMPVEKTFWSPAFGMLVDRFG
jgi:PhnB protein